MEKRRESADNHLRLVVRELVDKLDRVTKCRRTGRIGGRHALVVDRLVGGVGAGVALVCVDYAVKQFVEKLADSGVVLLEHAALKTQKQRQVVA